MRPSTGLFVKVWPDRTCAPWIDRTPPEAVTADPEAHEDWPQRVVSSEVPLNSSTNPGASCSAPPPASLAYVPLNVPPLKSARLDCVQIPLVVKDQVAGPVMALPDRSVAPLTVTVYVTS